MPPKCFTFKQGIYPQEVVPNLQEFSFNPLRAEPQLWEPSELIYRTKQGSTCLRRYVSQHSSGFLHRGLSFCNNLDSVLYWDGRVLLYEGLFPRFLDSVNLPILSCYLLPRVNLSVYLSRFLYVKSSLLKYIAWFLFYSHNMASNSCETRVPIHALNSISA